MKNIRRIRLFCNQQLFAGRPLELPEKQSHYLCNVMRCQKGDTVSCFNALDGEFGCLIEQADKKKTVVIPQKQTRRPEKEADIWLLFAPLKKDKTDFVIEKAVELGVSGIIPVITRYTNAEKVKTERFIAQAAESAEQCGRLSVPAIVGAENLQKVIASWDKNRVLFFMDERRAGSPAAEVFKNYCGRPAAILIGPEGGFCEEEAALLNEQPFVKNLSLGPRVLRAETAVAAALAVWQAVAGDWTTKEKR